MKKRQYSSYDAAFSAQIDAWQPIEGGFLEAFGREGFDALNGRERGFCAERRKIVFLTFESRLAPLGGLAAVVRLMPGFLKKWGGEVIVLTPLYVNIPRVREAIDGGVLELVIPEMGFCALPKTGDRDGRPYGGGMGERGGAVASRTPRIPRTSGTSTTPYESVFCCYRDADASVATYYIGIKGRFTASVNPYSYDDSGEILEDSLAFCAAVPFALKELGYDRDLLFHAHDWETAPVALTSKFAVLEGLLENARTVLTLHNSFDSGIGVGRKRLFWGDSVRGDTVLQCTIPLLNGPLTTVSTPFAREMRRDALQRTVFTNHLQGVFAVNPPIGIENGMFGKPYLRYTHSALSRARQGDFSRLLEQKARFREKMLEVVGSMDHPDIIGSLREVESKSISTDHSDAIDKPKNINTKTRPIFFMSGRLDLMQKGFDVIFQAMRRFPAGRAGLIFCPSSADPVKHSSELAFFRGIAEERPGDIVVWPFRILAEDYVSVVLGSSFLLMPSFYEPFGAATEGFMHGTPVVARATGGLLVQVNTDGEAATGILYREGAGSGGGGAACDQSECDGWRDILGAPVGERVRVPLYQSMVSEAYLALVRAADIFADGQAYGRMALCGMDGLRSFSWDAAVWKYRRVYDAASRRNI